MKSTNVYLKNQNQRARARAEFSSRLTKLLIEKGKCSTRASKLADPKFLAELVDCSLNMARRYLLGQSIPTEANLKKISEWANVDPSWLLYGNTQANSQNDLNTTNAVTDKVLLTEILIQLRPYLLEPSLSEQAFQNYISFAVDIYDNIFHFEADFDSKIKMIEIMVKSIDLSKKKTNKSTGTDV